MFKRPDSDIFGTKQLDQGIKIKNDSFVDPNEAFKKKNDENYNKYINKVGNVGKKNINGNPEMTKVNEKVNFDDEYHKDRKFLDLQSNVFGQEKVTRPKTSQQPSALREKKTPNQIPQEVYYGRKNTLKREVESLPYNQSHIKGNASQLFDFDSKLQTSGSKKDQPTLIPHQMQWDQHDSIRYNHHKQNIGQNLLIGESNIFSKQEETHSVQDPCQKIDRKQTIRQLKSLENKNNDQKLTKVEATKQSDQKQKQNQNEESMKTQKASNQPRSNDVEIKIIKGWDNKLMEGLSKYCKLFSTPMTKFELEGPGKAVIFLKRTKKWEAVTDWLTKDAKLKIRVIGN